MPSSFCFHPHINLNTWHQRQGIEIQCSLAVALSQPSVEAERKYVPQLLLVKRWKGTSVQIHTYIVPFHLADFRSI